jgi:hypothetical protein
MPASTWVSKAPIHGFEKLGARRGKNDAVRARGAAIPASPCQKAPRCFRPAGPSVGFAPRSARARRLERRDGDSKSLTHFARFWPFETS